VLHGFSQEEGVDFDECCVQVDVGADCPCAWWISSPLGNPRGRYDEYSS
jgi:hypothetical protein